jgi:HAD superfamily hydrolase (TIGR01509 family)
MDGTLLDLHYDNHLWDTLLPRWYAKAQDLTESDAREILFSYMQRVKGTLEFYCLDHWAEFTQLDMRELHLARTDLVSYRAGARDFLAALQQSSINTLLITNAHRMSLEVKDTASAISSMVDHTISCHDYGAPKEAQAFWQTLQARHPFDPARTLFIDDNHDVLNSAAQFGIRHLRTIEYPDSQREAKPNGEYLVAGNLATLFDLGGRS